MSAPDIVVTHRYGQPVGRVFDAFLDPATVADWLFATPDGAMERADYDPRVGGRFALFERRGDQVAHHHGRFVEIVRPERVVFDFRVDETPDDWTRVRVDFAPDGDGACLTLSHDLAQAWKSHGERTVHGWTTILDALDRVVSR